MLSFLVLVRPTVSRRIVATNAFSSPRILYIYIQKTTITQRYLSVLKRGQTSAALYAYVLLLSLRRAKRTPARASFRVRARETVFILFFIFVNITPSTLRKRTVKTPNMVRIGAAFYLFYYTRQN